VAEIYIGLMSGTSADSIDCAALDLSSEEIKVLGYKNFEIPKDLKKDIIQSSQSPKVNKDLIHNLDLRMADVLVGSVKAILTELSINIEAVKGIGSHGQTIKHEPRSKFPYTLQIGNPQKISDDLNLRTVGNYRHDDIEAGGEGAPLTPIFHEKVFGKDKTRKVIINIGGIANITYLDYPKKIGFDSGPGNCLMDSWSRAHDIGNYDDKGAWASSGTINLSLLEIMMSDEYFLRDYPKSTGPDYFSYEWIQKNLRSLSKEISPEDVQATLLQVTTLSLIESMNFLKISDENIYLCGGGVHNEFLCNELKKQSKLEIRTTLDLGIDPDYLEAICFGWLAKQRIENKKFNLSDITGSNGEVYLGRIYEPSK
tara:strand:+ start:21 stop:1127 length:1107 start_codon:yes stop_codon:yes gene_type:complete